MSEQHEAEIAALRLIVGNLVARMARGSAGQSTLREMADQCKLARRAHERWPGQTSAHP